MQINEKQLVDVWIGDVWLCSGQSNMEALLSRPNIKARYTDVISTSNYPMIRQFTVNRDMAFIPIVDVASDKGWVGVNPETILSFLQ
jgi:sialate O-acetylesterase